MSGAANQSGYGNTNSPWGPGPTWNAGGPDLWRWWYAAKPLWIAVMVLGFIFWWPVGLAILLFGIWGKRMAYWGCGPSFGGWQNNAWQNSNGGPPWANWKSFCCGSRPRQAQQPPSSGNRAFDEYRMETLRRLEEEQQEFAAFLERLRVAKDKAEFDQFMADRRKGPPAPTHEPPPAAA